MKRFWPKSHTEAIKSGRAARFKRLPAHRNPYTAGQWAEWFLWDFGWREMDRNMRSLGWRPERPEDLHTLGEALTHGR